MKKNLKYIEIAFYIGMGIIILAGSIVMCIRVLTSEDAIYIPLYRKILGVIFVTPFLVFSTCICHSILLFLEASQDRIIKLDYFILWIFIFSAIIWGRCDKILLQPDYPKEIDTKMYSYIVQEEEYDGEYGTFEEMKWKYSHQFDSKKVQYSLIEAILAASAIVVIQVRNNNKAFPGAHGSHC